MPALDAAGARDPALPTRRRIKKRIRKTNKKRTAAKRGDNELRRARACRCSKPVLTTGLDREITLKRWRQ
jgi:hypothetical protein